LIAEMELYTNRGPVDVTSPVDHSKVKGKSIIITGGANGIGEANTRAFVQAGAFVTIGDLDSAKATALASELGAASTQFIHCDVLQWTDQFALFKSAISASPSKRIDIVLANAGIFGQIDTDYMAFDTDAEPHESSLKILDTNIQGVMLTTELILHYFQKQYKTTQFDTLLMFQGSLAGYLDQPGWPQYCTSKWALRGLLHSLRRTSFLHGTRVNYMALWAIPTKGTAIELQAIEDSGLEWARLEHAAGAALRFVCDSSMWGEDSGGCAQELAKHGLCGLCAG